MNIFESFRIAWVALTTNKMRALLTMLGIIIGVSAVISMLAIGNGLSKSIQGEFNRLGAGVFYITPQITSPDADATQAPQLTAADAEALVQPGAAPAVRAVAVEYSTSAVVSAGGERYYYPIKGITPNYFTISDNTLGAGRYYGEDDERGRARVAVIGQDVATALFGSATGAIGQRVTVNGINFDVVGVLTTKPSQAADFNKPTETVYIPYETARTRLFRNELSAKVDLSQITVQARGKRRSCCASVTG
jgi:putative ABC transport system permease protein